MEKQEKKKENESKVGKIKVGTRRGKKEMNKILTKKDIMDEAFRRIREMEKYREKNKVVDLSKVNEEKVKDEKKATKDSKVSEDKKKATKDSKVKEKPKDSQATKDSQTITKDIPSTTKRKSSGYIWVKKRNPTKESQTLKIYTNPLDRTRAALLDKLERKLNDYFSVVPEDLKKVNVLKVLQSLKGNKTITVSIGECSYIFEGEKMESNEKFKDPQIKEIISNMVKSLRNL